MSDAKNIRRLVNGLRESARTLEKSANSISIYPGMESFIKRYCKDILEASSLLESFITENPERYPDEDLK